MSADPVSSIPNLRPLDEEKPEAERLLSESEQTFALLVGSVKDYAIFMLDPSGRIMTWNAGAELIKGYRASEIVGRHFSVFYPQEDIDSKKPEWELEVASQTGRYEEEGWRVRKDGTRFWANAVITAIFNSKNRLIGFGKVTRDLTERMRAEDRLRAAYADLEKRVETRTKELSEAVKVRDEFLSIASHELKTPITSLKLQMQMLLKRIQNQSDSALEFDKIRYSTEVSVRQISRLNALVDDLLDVSRVRAGRLTLHFEQVDLVALAQEVVHRMTEQLKSAGCSVELVAPAKLSAWADPQRLDQVLTNFLSNAAKYAPHHPVVVQVSDLGGRARISVRDHGPGIPVEEQERIFDRFERAASSDISGMGLGLYISRSIVLAHQGEIRVESEPGKGASFIFEIPTEPRLDQ